ncbi:MAG: family transposase [Firmicutes bacterium]|nr:family transposase [Bacillota bacterium]
MIIKSNIIFLRKTINSLYRWINEYQEYGESAFPGHGSALYNSQYEIKKLNRENEVLSTEIRKIFEEHKGRYGSIRISKALDKKVSLLMRGMKLYPRGTRYRYKRYNQELASVERPNLLN